MWKETLLKCTHQKYKHVCSSSLSLSNWNARNTHLATFDITTLETTLISRNYIENYLRSLDTKGRTHRWSVLPSIIHLYENRLLNIITRNRDNPGGRNVNRVAINKDFDQWGAVAECRWCSFVKVCTWSMDTATRLGRVLFLQRRYFRVSWRENLNICLILIYLFANKGSLTMFYSYLGPHFCACGVLTLTV